MVGIIITICLRDSISIKTQLQQYQRYQKAGPIRGREQSKDLKVRGLDVNEDSS